MQLTKCMALEFERRKQRVASILLHPGTVDTDLSKPFQKVRPQQCGGVAVAVCRAQPKNGGGLARAAGRRLAPPWRV